MKILMVSDLQQHKWKLYPEVDENGVNLRILDTFNELGRIRQMAVKNKIDALFVLGDIFEARNELHISVLNSIYNALKGYVDCGVRVVLLVGNHDRTGVGKEHALEVFTSFCEVIDKPTTLKLPEGEILALPFFPNSKTTVKAIQHFTTPKTKLIVAHTAVQSLKMPNGELWGQGVSLHDIPKHVIFVSGHYHRFTELIPGRAYFIGSMIQVDRSDASFDKYFAVYESSAHKITFHQTKGPRFVSVDIPNLSQPVIEELALICKGNFVTVKSVPPGYHEYGEIMLALQNIGARHIDFAMVMPTQIPPMDIAAQAQGFDNLQIVQHYVDEQAKDIDLEKEKLIEIGESVVTEVEDEVENTVFKEPIEIQ